MDRTTIFRKTALGAQAIATRQSGLAPRQRAVLVMVDGRHTAEVLIRIGSACGNVEELLGAFVQQGFIEPVPAAAPAPAAAVAEAAHWPISLARAQRIAVRRVNDLLGPSGTDLCVRLEASRTAQEFGNAVKKAEAVLRQALNAQAAERFVQEVRSAPGA